MLLSRYSITFLLFASPLAAQTVQNPSFEVNPSVPLLDASGPWSTGPITNWTIIGSAGLWQPISAEFQSLPDGATVAYSNGGILSEDLGASAAANATYTLTVWVGRRADQWGSYAPTSVYTISLMAGATIFCTQSAPISTIPSGTFVKQTLSCPVGATPPPDNLSINLAANGIQADFDNVTLTTGSQTIPLALSFPGSGSGQGFTLTVNAVTVPSCNVATDGDCSLALQISAPNTSCSVDSTNTITCSGGGTLAITKTSSLPTPQVLTTIIANVKSQ